MSKSLTTAGVGKGFGNIIHYFWEYKSTNISGDESEHRFKFSNIDNPDVELHILENYYK